MKPIKSRIEELERRSRTAAAMLYLVTVADGVFTVTDDGIEYHFTQDEFAEWEKTKSDNDLIYIITRRESAKENEND